MDAFKVHERLIDDYRSFTEGFVDIRDDRLREKFEQLSLAGAQWPDPWLSLNPSFADGGAINELVDQGLLDPRCLDIFATKREGHARAPFALYRHQREAIEAAARGRSYVLTTGTGSGKSLSYIVPMVDRVLRNGSGRGIRGIVVYPMNALANSQVEELNKFLLEGFTSPPVIYRRYTGQEHGEARRDVLDHPPDILLTNYVMLELMLTRPEERRLLQHHASELEFLVLDELHTYRGRQGADVAMLVRRIRDLTGRGSKLQCVGTSATMSSGTTTSEQQRDVAAVATRIFGTGVEPADVIVETLVQATTVRSPAAPDLREAVERRGQVEHHTNLSFGELSDDPLASWIEDAFGIQPEPGTDRLVRRPPTTVREAAASLSELTSNAATQCENALRATLLAGSAAKDSRTGRSFFAFRLHQFLAKAGALFVTADPPSKRTITADYQVVLQSGPQEKRLYPLAFCRECGQEYLMARSVQDEHGRLYLARQQIKPADRTEGYLFVSTDREWPVDPIAEGRLPQSWLTQQGANPIVTRRRDDVPRRVLVAADGRATWADQQRPTRPDAVVAAWIPGVFRFCLHCGVTYEALRSSELSKLATLDREGRSSAMSVVASSLVRALRDPKLGDVPAEARKLLTFVDNRQDAALQAGHFNDFVQVMQLRAAMYAAVVEAGQGGLDPLDLGPEVSRTLNLSLADYAQVSEVLDERPLKRALRDVVEYRTLRDLQKGLRVTLPNLEQCGLMKVTYPAVTALCQMSDRWSQTHPRLESMRPGQREELVTVLLDEMRRVLAIDAEALSQDFVDRLRRQSREYLSGVLAVGETEADPVIGLATSETGQRGAARSVVNLTGRSAYGRWLRSLRSLPGLDVVDAAAIIESLLALLLHFGIITKVVEQGTSGYRVKSSSLSLHAGDGQVGAADPLRRTFDPDHAPRVIAFFKDLYVDSGHQLSGLRAAEHTAQVRAQDREDREKAFRSADLPLLFCSPTMELGVDIASLNAVALRNVPPTPANYAQRSGRAGRSGQQALVVTYCSSGNAHDNYYFQRSDQMVAGKVTPPRLDLANEDLVRSHVHAMWLAEVLSASPAGLQSSMATVVDLADPEYALRSELAQLIHDPTPTERARETAQRVLTELEPELARSVWWTPEWSDRVIDRASVEFDRACNRWRELYRAAESERILAEQLAADHAKSRDERRDADRRRGEARQRIELLLNESDARGQSDFYTYRYLASEGFLPGYSFPRLPLAAYIPGARRGREGTWLQRPRFLAISEFGPNALIYHEGARYQVTRIALPRGSRADGSGDVVRSRLKVCTDCGYHHDADPGPDLCESCRAPLGETWRELLQLQSVITRRRERISADEEERNRVGYELRTSYRFMPRGPRPGYAQADVLPQGADEPVAEVVYGDSAEIRVTNLGRRNRANRNVQGFYLDLVKGRWLSETAAGGEQAEEDDGLEASQQDVKAKARVTPYVLDRRNVVVLRWADNVDDDTAITLQFALERGMEIHFQLEDSELASERLPDGDDRGRVLFIESAEGGAGVLRRLQAEAGALAGAARAALELVHVDPESGTTAADACTRGCYRCLLSYGNQTVHERIDRRLAIPLLQRLLTAETRPETRPPTAEQTVPQRRPMLSGRAGQMEEWLDAAGLRRPAEVDVMKLGVHVDLMYSQLDPQVAVVLDNDHDPQDVTPLVFDNVDVISVKADSDLWEIITQYPNVFGVAESRPVFSQADVGRIP